jgi:hypothetical protein
MEIIKGFQGELSLSYEDILRLEKNDELLLKIADAIDAYMEENDLYILSLGRYDVHTQKVVDIIDKLLDY